MLDKLPRGILLFDILELLDSESLIKLSFVSKYFNTLVNDESIWKKLCLQEFNISQDYAYRNKGWKTFYQALKYHARVYTWGENVDSRLGLDYPADSTNEQDADMVFQLPFRRHRNISRRYPSEVTTPQELHSLKNHSIIDIASGGWSFHALDTSGSVYMWGTMQQELSPRSSYGTKRLTTPTLLQTGNETQPKIKFRSISSGRGHVIGLARDGTVWHWSNHVTLQRVDIEDRIVQVAANWNYSSALTENGKLLVIPKPDLIIQSQLQVEPTPTVIIASAVSVSDMVPDISSDDRIVQIAGLDGYTIALTRNGRVLKVSTGDGFPTQAIELIKYSSETKENNERHGIMARFITGAFNHFAVYTKDKVMMGNVDVAANTEPTRIEALDHQDVCRVSFGDYHYGALTSQGKLLTWGKNSSGALGQGDNTEDPCPTPRIVQSLNNSFVFAIGFGGWQSSALAIDNIM